MTTAKQKKHLWVRFAKPDTKHPATQYSTPLCGSGVLMARDPQTRELVDAIDIRCYFNPRGNGMQPVRASIWITAPRGSGLEWATGTGSASGCGYHKESAAIEAACDAAGVQLFGNCSHYRDDPKPDKTKRTHFGGTGSSYYETIFTAIAKARGFRAPFKWVSRSL